MVSVTSRGWSIRAALELQVALAVTGMTCLEQHRWQSAAETQWLQEYELAAHFCPGSNAWMVACRESMGKKPTDLSITTHMQAIYITSTMSQGGWDAAR